MGVCTDLVLFRRSSIPPASNRNTATPAGRQVSGYIDAVCQAIIANMNLSPLLINVMAHFVQLSHSVSAV